MAKRMHPKKTIHRELTEAQKQADWYVDLPDDRPTFGRPRISTEEWIPLVNSRITIGADGVRVLGGPSLMDEVVVGTPEWKNWLRGFAISLNRRLFWEPLESVGLTAEGVRRYGGCGDDLLPDVDRRAKREAQTARRRNLKAARGQRQLAVPPSLFD